MLRSLLFAGLALASVTISGCDLNGYGEMLTFEGNELYYTDSVTEAEAQKLGELLVKKDYFNNKKRRSVQLNKADDTYQVRMVVVADYKSKTGIYPLAFQSMASMISKEAFEGRKVEIHLCNDRLETMEVLKPIVIDERKDTKTAEATPANNTSIAKGQSNK